MEIYSIFAKDLANAIGEKGGLAFKKLDGELKNFSKKTKGKNWKKGGKIVSAVIMGRATYESLYKRKNGSRALPNRHNIVVSNNKEFKKNNTDSIIIVSSIKEALKKAIDMQEVWFIGGSRIYSEAMNYVDGICVTQIFGINKKADTFVEEIDQKVFKRVWASPKKYCKNNKLYYRFEVFKRR